MVPKRLYAPRLRPARWVPFALSATALASLTMLDARAQDVPAPANAASAPRSLTLDQVTVTAQKRKEDPKKVPLSISVVTGEAIQDGHIANLADLTRTVPNVSFTAGGSGAGAGAGLSNLEMRGISSQAGSATVSIYLDDISLTSRNLNTQGTAEPRFFDIDRVEVLRGPQGTLYGASSLGGTVKFISNQPDATRFGGSAYTELSTTSHGGTNYLGQAVLNIPLVQGTTALRIGVQTGHDSGYIDQVSPSTLAVIDKGINSTQWDVLKLSLKSDFAPGWSVTPSLFYQRFKSDDNDAAYRSVGEYQITDGSTPRPLALFQTSKIVREPGTDTLTIPSVTLNGDLGFADLTGVLSAYKRRFDRIQDGTYINSYEIYTITDPTLDALVRGLPSQVQLSNKTDQASLELRLASKNYVAGANPFTWVGGVYASQTRTQVFDNEPILGINAAFAAAGININDPAQLQNSFPGAFGSDDSSYYSARHYKDRELAIFGELTYNFDASLRATVGLRAARDTQAFSNDQAYYYTGGAPATYLSDIESHPVTPRFALSWDASREASFYANIAKGIRLGSAQRHVPTTPLVQSDLTVQGLPFTNLPDTYKSDSLWSYEAGMKSRWLENRLAINLAIFHIDWKNIQQNINLQQSGYTFETNAGNAKVDGIEIEGKLRAAEGLTLSAGASYTRAVFADDAPAFGVVDPNTPGSPLTVKKGDLVQGVPKYSAQLGAEYRFAPMAFGNTFVRANGQWTGSSRGALNHSSSDYVRPGYFTADASAGLSLDSWEFSVFAKNLGNNHREIQTPSIQGVDEAYYLRPRTIGVTAQYTF